jgi:hypothetical protein
MSRYAIDCAKGYADELLLQRIASPTIVFDRCTSGYTLAESFSAAAHFVSRENIVIGDPLCCPDAKRNQSFHPIFNF